MPTLVQLNEQDAERVADVALRAQFHSYGFDHVEVRSGQDHDGDDALFVTAYIGADVGPLAGDLLGQAHAAVHDGLLAKGERRFPYFRVRRLGDAPVGDDMSADIP